MLKNVNFIQNQGICIGCGLCTAACPESAIMMHWGRGLKWVPHIDAAKCRDCGLCYQICPNTPGCICEYATAAAKKGECFGLQDAAQYFISYDLNSKNRIRSASGGALTATLVSLLEKGEIDGVVASVPLSAPIGKPHYGLRVIRSISELDKARSSHYYPLCYDRVFGEIKDSSGRYAVVGVPCVIRGIKRFPEKLRSKIRYTFNLVCSHNVNGAFLDCLAKQEGVREGESFIANLRDKLGGITDAENFNNYFGLPGREIRHNRFQTTFTDMWRNYFFTHECCLYCPDYYGADADFSVKDAWGRLSSDPLGISLLIVRNPELVSTLQELKRDARLFLEPCDRNEVLKSDISPARFKHVGVHDRLVWKSIIRRELLKNGYPLRASRRLWKESSFRYWQLRMMIGLSNFFYSHWGHVSVRKSIRLGHILMCLVIFIVSTIACFWKGIRKCQDRSTR